MLGLRIGFNLDTDPDLAFNVNADPDPQIGSSNTVKKFK
jgi:hypothetical protein